MMRNLPTIALLLLASACTSQRKESTEEGNGNSSDGESQPEEEVPSQPEEDSNDPADTGTDSGEYAEPEDTGEPAFESDCTAIEICDDFEGSVPGSLPDSADWTIETPNCSGLGEVVVADDHAHSGSNSIRVLGTGSYCDHIFISPTADVDGLGPELHGRFWMRIENAFGWEHITFLAMKDEIEDRDLRMGGQSQILMWNRESDDATLPELSPTGISLSLAPPAQEWFCVRFRVDESTGKIDTWVNELPIEGLLQDNNPTNDVDRQWNQQKPNWAPSLIDIKLGWESYGNSENMIWYDDLAFSSAPLECN